MTNLLKHAILLKTLNIVIFSMKVNNLWIESSGDQATGIWSEKKFELASRQTHRPH